MSKKGEGFKSGLMVLDMTGIGSMIWRMDMEDLFMRMEMFTKVNGLTIRHMGSESTCIWMGLCMRASGRMINRMDLERRNGLMDQCMKGIMSRVKRLVKENLLGLMEVHMRGTLMIPLRVTEPIHGQTNVSMLETGKTTKCTARVCSLGQMGDDLRGFTSTTKSTEMGTLHGQMADLLKEPGSMVSKMVLESILTTKVNLNMVSGKMG